MTPWPPPDVAKRQIWEKEPGYWIVKDRTNCGGHMTVINSWARDGGLAFAIKTWHDMGRYRT